MMFISRKQFLGLASLVALSGFAGGLLSGRVWRAGEACAQDRPATTTINVGPQGLAFRGPDGRIIARLSSEAGGGVFEVYNANEQPGSRMRASSFSGAVEVLPSYRHSLPSPPPPLPAQAPWPPSATAVRDLGF